MTSSPGERWIVALGILPLAAAAAWLIVLHEPPAAVAHATAGEAERHTRPETSGLGKDPGFVGVIVAGQDADLGAELGGEVVKIFAEPGARVKRGQPIAQLAALSVMGASNMAAAQAQEDKAALTAAQLAVENARDKAERMAAAPAAYPARELHNARAEADRAAADVQRLRGSAAVHRASFGRELARAEKQTIRAPFTGVLAARFFDVGDFVSPGQAVARVVDDARFVRFALPAAEHAVVQVGSDVRALVSGSSVPLGAQIVDVDPELDPAAGLGFARAKLVDDGVQALRLSPGTRVAVFFQGAQQP
jgi:membrane fusion protein (multidrug efflux system)